MRDTPSLSQPETASSAPASHAPEMSVQERREQINQQITLWIGNRRLDAALAAEELGQYSGMQKALLLRNGLLVGAVRHCRINPRADTRMSILTLITFLSDNNDGICRLSVTRMCEIFARSRESIVSSISSLERDGQIGVNRSGGMPNCYWPLIPAALAELSANPVWFVDALSTKPKFRVFGSPEQAIAVAARSRSTLPDQSTAPDQSSGPDHHWSTPVGEPVNSSRRTGQEASNSISLSNSPSISSLPNGKDAAASPKNSTSFKKLVWNSGIAYLVAAYNELMPEKDIRSRLGRLVKDHGEGFVLDALSKAQKAEAVDPFDYMQGILRSVGQCDCHGC